MGFNAGWDCTVIEKLFIRDHHAKKRSFIEFPIKTERFDPGQPTTCAVLFLFFAHIEISYHMS